jgi:hypothetical protein
MIHSLHRVALASALRTGNPTLPQGIAGLAAKTPTPVVVFARHRLLSITCHLFAQYQRVSEARRISRCLQLTLDLPCATRLALES